MKKKSLKSFALNKKVISKLGASAVVGGISGKSSCLANHDSSCIVGTKEPSGSKGCYYEPDGR